MPRGCRQFSLERLGDSAPHFSGATIDPSDWPLLLCQVYAGGVWFINVVGTRSRLRVVENFLYLAGSTATTWHELVADDFHLKAGCESFRVALLEFFVLCGTAGVPLSKSKTVGGDIVSWVEVEILHNTHQLGISQRRAVRSTIEVADSHTINMRSFEEGL